MGVVRIRCGSSTIWRRIEPRPTIWRPASRIASTRLRHAGTPGPAESAPLTSRRTGNLTACSSFVGGLRGLCHKGAWECAVGAMRSLDLDGILERLRSEMEIDVNLAGKRENE